MDLKEEDVADLLNISKKKVFELAKNGKIPSYQLKGEYRFNYIEIENWMMNRECKNVKFSKKGRLKDESIRDIISKKIGMHAFSLFRAVHKGGVITDALGNTKFEVIEKAVDIIAKNLGLDATVLTELLIDREKLMSTSLGHGIAIPHARDFIFPKPFDVVSVVFLKEPIDYGALDGEKVHTLFFLFACDEKRHLHLLAKMQQ